MTPEIAVIILAWGDEPLLRECVQSAIDSEGVDVTVILVDNGASEQHVSAAAALPGVTVLRPGANLGFAGGCNLGASLASAPTLVFLNSDARLDPQALHRLQSELSADVGLTMASVRLWNEPDRMNTAGNPWHYLGFVWAGGLNDDSAAHSVSQDVTCASGATMAIRREQWNEMGGFDDAYFAYHEDAELSLRIWQRGLRVRFVADAISYHHYEFSRNANKQYLLERNRVMSLLTLYERRTLVLLAPILGLIEVGVLITAARQKWLREKKNGYVWLYANRKHWLARRREVQAARTRTDRDLAPLFTSTIDADALGDFPGLSVVNAVMRSYWTLARRLLAR